MNNLIKYTKVMKQLILTFILLLFSSYFICAQKIETQYFKYNGCKINMYDIKDFDSSEGIIIVDYKKQQVHILIGPNNILFNDCPITYSNIGGNVKEKIVVLMDENTNKNEECALVFNFPNRNVLLRYGTDPLSYDCSFVFLNLELIDTIQQ